MVEKDDKAAPSQTVVTGKGIGKPTSPKLKTTRLRVTLTLYDGTKCLIPDPSREISFLPSSPSGFRISLVSRETLVPLMYRSSQSPWL